MRSAAAALALGLLLIASGCGTSSAATQTSSGTDAASLVPASALAYVSADANLDSQQWQVLTDVFGPLPSKLDYKNDIHPALGDRVNLAVLGIDNGKPEAVALVQPTDEAKLSALAKKFDQGSEHYTVEQIGGWSVVADSAEAFQSVRNADSGSSLADTANFKSAMSQVGDTGFATVYASGSGVQQLPAKLQALVRVAGSPRWVAASITADKTALQIKARAAGGTSPAAYRPTLLHDVPSGAILAVSFKDVNQLLARVQSEPLLRTSLPPFVTALRSVGGEGVLYLLPGTLIPVVTLEVHPSDPVGCGNGASRSRREGREHAAAACRTAWEGRSPHQRSSRHQSRQWVDHRRSVVQGCARRSRCPRQGHMAGVRRHPTARTAPAGTCLADRERTGKAGDDRKARQVPDARRIRRPLRLDEQRRGQAHLPLKLAGRSV